MTAEDSLACIDVSVIICTANRANDLRDTLASLAQVHCPGHVELLVVDNRSGDHTREVVDEAVQHHPFAVRYLFEGEAGKCAALNAGIKASKGRVIAATDDDARFEADWLERAVDGLSRYGCEFVGGRVDPVWGGPKPDWLDENNGLHAKVIALLDHGDRVREFGRGISWPLGVNVAYRREVFERVGLFDNRLGRTTGTLRNQSHREWHLRAWGAGARGFYLPGMVVHHLVASERLQKQYFRRWLYWHGISRAMLFRQSGFDMEEPELQHTPHAGEPQICGVPWHLMGKALRTTRSLAWQTIKGNGGAAFECELWLCFFAGMARQRWADRHLAISAGPAAPARVANPGAQPDAALG